MKQIKNIGSIRFFILSKTKDSLLDAFFLSSPKFSDMAICKQGLHAVYYIQL